MRYQLIKPVNENYTALEQILTNRDVIHGHIERYINTTDEDIYLDEFADEIDSWVIDAIKAIGLDTAKAVLGVAKEDLVKRVDLEEETIDEVIAILAAEFED